MTPFKCSNCGNEEARTDRIDQVFNVEGRRVLVEGIPATVCTQCGEPTFAANTAEQVRRKVRGDAQPVRTIPLEVFAYN